MISIALLTKCDPALGRITLLDGFVDSWSVAQEKLGEATTWWPDPLIAHLVMVYGWNTVS